MNSLKQRITKASVLTGFFAGLLYGSWALYANYAAGTSIALQASAVQFVCSAFIGFIMTFMMDQICNSQTLSRIIIIPSAIILPMIFTFVVSYYAHYSNGTPNIMMTILPSQILGVVWTTLYTLKLMKQDRRNAALTH